MAITTTTLSSAAASGDPFIVVASATGFAAGLYVQIDSIEWAQVGKGYSSGTQIPLQRGLFGTVNGAHVSGCNVSVFALASDFAQFAPGQVTSYTPLAGRNRTITSVSAIQALPQPVAGQDLMIMLNGGTAVAYTLTSPTKDMDGCVVTCVSNQGKAHTITYTTTGFGGVGATADVLTFSATQAQAVQFVAANGVWNLIGHVAGAASVAGVGLG